MKSLEQIEAELQMWLARRETARTSQILLQYQGAEIEREIAVAQAEKAALAVEKSRNEPLEVVK